MIPVDHFQKIIDDCDELIAKLEGELLRPYYTKRVRELFAESIEAAGGLKQFVSASLEIVENANEMMRGKG